MVDQIRSRTHREWWGRLTDDQRARVRKAAEDNDTSSVTAKLLAIPDAPWDSSELHGKQTRILVELAKGMRASSQISHNADCAGLAMALIAALAVVTAGSAAISAPIAAEIIHLVIR
ncbi:hypothetical protein Y900_030965 [Mycolicibacterium aromaticivorans JS19b1 = JCM 16368]|uniref:Uncharacterized protein n=1 Tax=Mycolicibacterium aromaticivorans JS19b1 = JCM 16368 TaxID=1440774 RepID=A0A064CDC5_9MYCO|nr:hypothetical protein [Mycolicibacterium aromaticivorans]KDE96747.1 hypothetical protein Y900_030965 [Mycolicibacterium aromaticivorans JS19b1 = JCM 16368]